MRVTAVAAVAAGADPEKLGLEPVFLLSMKGVPSVEYVSWRGAATMSMQKTHIRVYLGHGKFIAALAVAGYCAGIPDWATVTLSGVLIPKAPTGNRPNDAKTWLTAEEISALVAEYDKKSTLAALKKRIREETERLRKKTKNPGFASKMSLARAKKDKAKRKEMFEWWMRYFEAVPSFSKRARRANDNMRWAWKNRRRHRRK